MKFFEGDVESVDLAAKEVIVSHGTDHHHHALGYDHLVIALGSITNFFNLPGLQERALTMKTLGDAIELRNRLIQHLEEADFECSVGIREHMLTFVVAGGGFAGVETIAAMNDFTRKERGRVTVNESLEVPDLARRLGARRLRRDSRPPHGQAMPAHRAACPPGGKDRREEHRGCD